MRSIVLLLVGVMAATSVSAAQIGTGPRGEPLARSNSRRVDVVVRGGGVNLTAQRTIREYYADKPRAVRELPPGVARNYARGRKLPAGIARRPLPPDLDARLPHQPGYQYIAVDRDVLLIAVSTGIVTDILLDVL